MRDNPLFTVIVATYQRPTLLREAIESVFQQTVRDFELIVVDDASPIPASVPPDRRVRLISRQQNGGAAAAWNTALKIARGRYITFLGDDDLYAPERLALSVEGHRQAPIAICWSRFVGRQSCDGRRLSGDVSDTILDATAPSLGATSVAAEIIVPFDERFRAAQDLEWWLRIAERGEAATVPSVGYLVRQHTGRRHGNDTMSRIHHSLLLMEVHDGYFKTHPRAAAFRWKRIGLMARKGGDLRLARTAFRRSLALHTDPASVWHFARSVGRSAHTEPVAADV